MLAGIGGLVGLAIGVLACGLVSVFLPNMPVELSLRYMLAAEFIALSIGLIAGISPAIRASRLDPVDALRAQ